MKADKLVPKARNGKIIMIDAQILNYRRLLRNQKKYCGLLSVRLNNYFNKDQEEILRWLDTYIEDLKGTPTKLIALKRAYRVWEYARYNLKPRSKNAASV